MGLLGLLFDKKAKNAALRIIDHAGSISSHVRESCKSAGFSKEVSDASEYFDAAIIIAICWTAYRTPGSEMSETILEKTFFHYHRIYGKYYADVLVTAYKGIMQALAALPNVIDAALFWLETALATQFEVDESRMTFLEQSFKGEVKTRMPAIIKHIQNPGDPEREERDRYARLGIDIDKLRRETLGPYYR